MLTQAAIFRLGLLLCTLWVGAGQAAEAPNIVTSIRPVQMLVAAVMQDVAMPTLLLDSAQSPHHASLRPSQMRALSRADLVFWIGPQLESFLPRVFRSLGSQTKTVALLQTAKLQTLPLRTLHGHEPSVADSETAIDPHIWLSSHNTRLLVAEIAAQLSAVDPAHAEQYQGNSLRLQQAIAALQAELAQNFKPGMNYLSYHDGYQYFEQEFKLHHAGSVSQNEELQPSAGHIQALRQQIQQQTISCMVYDAPQRPTLITTLLQDSSVRAVELDALGLRLAAGEQSWLSLMRKLAADFSACLSPQTTEK